ncbi:nuclear transport factor 2 family protein [Stutzerimonas nitrititolerans]|uniref:nuclear transport factor 2 family protein n=1 Tax=Stutzerimonas nitrititolerans TaxID=2482751 RepID=UPI0028A9D2C5|nr:nuclear transport factor 2 family protein [Stutzerimonas nitrititolerans]
MDFGKTSRRELQHDVQELIARHAELIDDDRLEEWPDLFVEDCVYKVIPRENEGPSQAGASRMEARKRHSLLYSIAGSNDDARDKQVYESVRTFNTGFHLQDASLFKGRAEFADGVTLVILSVFPSVALQQIQNTLAVRQIATHGPGAFEPVWTQFGYADDDDEEMQAIRVKQSNLIGPAGLISMEDGEAVEIVQNAVVLAQDQTSYIAMSGGGAKDADHPVTEGDTIGFWQNYERLVGFEGAAG